MFLNLFRNFMDYFGRYRLIKDKKTGEPYLERFYIFLKDRENFPFNIFLHRFLKSDPDGLHDHPWNYRTFILSGGYYEQLSDNKLHWRKPFTYRFSKAETFHRIELDKDQKCWTIFIPGVRRKEWGFIEEYEKWLTE